MITLASLPPRCRYTPDVFDPADQHLARLLTEVPWHSDFLPMYGKLVPVPRLIAMFGESYRYSGLDHPGLPWTPLLSGLREQVELVTGLQFNAVLLNYYRDGKDYIGPHSDDDYPNGGQPHIASVSFGATRRFLFRAGGRKTGPPDFEIPLEDRSVLLLDSGAIEGFTHGIPKEMRVKSPRMNLTFRHIVNKR